MKRNRNTIARNIPHGYFALKPGTKVKVKNCAFAYPLPKGLSPGDEVTIVQFAYGYYIVEKDGTRIEINSTNIYPDTRGCIADWQSAVRA